MSNIPEARKRLMEIAAHLKKQKKKRLAADIELIVGEMLYRRDPVRRMPRKSRRVTDDIKQAVIEMAEETDLHCSEIAAEMHINPGRVSEILQGDR